VVKCRGCGVVVWFTINRLCFVLVRCPTSVLDVNVSALTNYVESHFFTNPTIDLVYKTPWHLHPTNLLSSPLQYAPPGAPPLGPVISRFALQLCSKWIGTLRPDPFRSSGPDKYLTDLLGHSTCLVMLPYSAGILGVTRATNISRASRQTRRGERTRCEW